MIAFVEDLLRSRTRRGNPLLLGESDERCEFVTRAFNVRCSALEVVRALDATHKAIAESRAAPGGNNTSRVRIQ